jgi:hypothetical protein
VRFTERPTSLGTLLLEDGLWSVAAGDDFCTEVLSPVRLVVLGVEGLGV